jgi:hypothetical protein
MKSRNREEKTTPASQASSSQESYGEKVVLSLCLSLSLTVTQQEDSQDRDKSQPIKVSGFVFTSHNKLSIVLVLFLGCCLSLRL